MNKLLLIMIIVTSMVLSFSCKSITTSTQKKPILSGAEVIAIANTEASRQGYDLAEYEVPCTEYELTAHNQDWLVFYKGKEQVPGNHFLVIIDDRTGKSRLARGK